MRNRHRATFGDLLPETRNDASVRTKHIPEARRNETRLPLRMSLLDRQPQRLHIDFRKAFGAPHHVRRVHSLVRRDHHHLFHVVFDALVRHVARSGDIHQHRLARVLLHQRNMFIGRGMEHHLRMVRPEHEVQPGRNPHVADNGDEFQIRIAFFQFQAQVVHRSLPIIIQNKFPDTERCQLAA